MPATSAVRGVLLDIDGTLLDSNDAHARAWIEAFEGNGVALPFDQARTRIGKGGDKVLWELAGVTESSPEGQRIARVRTQIFRARYLPELAPLPGARALVERMRRGGLRLVVATSSSSAEVDALLTAAGVRDLVGEEITKDDANASKPDPDIIVAAIERSKLPREALVMLGDTPYDVLAATKAGVRTVALRCGGWNDDDLRGAVAIYDDPQDLLDHYGEVFAG